MAYTNQALKLKTGTRLFNISITRQRSYRLFMVASSASVHLDFGQKRGRTKEFISRLTQHTCQSAFQYRHKWHAGDAVLWDNRRGLHAGTSYDVINSRCLIHGTTIRETAPLN